MVWGSGSAVGSIVGTWVGSGVAAGAHAANTRAAITKTASEYNLFLDIFATPLSYFILFLCLHSRFKCYTFQEFV
jgi:hypothetical protein